jgi:hypothetical protein
MLPANVVQDERVASEVQPNPGNTTDWNLLTLGERYG